LISSTLDAPALDLDGVPLVGELGSLSSNHLELGVDTTPITIPKKLQGIPGRRNGFLLLLRFVFENAQGTDVVFHFLKRSQ
jgi:hypothetical protein